MWKSRLKSSGSRHNLNLDNIVVDDDGSLTAEID